MLLVSTRFVDAVVGPLRVQWTSDDLGKVFIIRHTQKGRGAELAHILSTRVVFDQVYMPGGQDFTIR